MKEFAKLEDRRRTFLPSRTAMAAYVIRQSVESLRFWEKHTQRVRMLCEIAKWIGARDQDKLAWVVRWPKGEDQPLIRPGAALDYLDAREERRPYEPIPDDARSPPIVNPRAAWPTPVASLGSGRSHGAASMNQALFGTRRGSPRWSSGEVIGPALFYVCDELNKAVRGHVSTKLMPFAPGELFRVYVVPDCLLATIYLQLQLALGHGTARQASPKTSIRASGSPARQSQTAAATQSLSSETSGTVRSRVRNGAESRRSEGIVGKTTSTPTLVTNPPATLRS